MKWFLSVAVEDLPFDAQPGVRTTYRAINVDGEEVEFSDGFADLHTRIYERTLIDAGVKVGETIGELDLFTIDVDGSIGGANTGLSIERKVFDSDGEKPLHRGSLELEMTTTPTPANEAEPMAAAPSAYVTVRPVSVAIVSQKSVMSEFGSAPSTRTPVPPLFTFVKTFVSIVS